MTSEKIDILSVAECLCKRPMMYTASGSIEEIIAFLSGYEAASSKSVSIADSSPIEALNWIFRKCGVENRFRYGLPGKCLELIQLNFGSSAELLSQLGEYLQSRKSEYSKNV